MAHEFFFKQARQAGYKNSDFVREKVGQFLSVKGMDPLFKEWIGSKDFRVSDILPESMEGFKFCTGTSNEDVNAKLQFYQYEGKDHLQHFVIPLLQSSSVSLSLLKDNHFSFNPRTNKDLAFGTDLIVFHNKLIESFLTSDYEHSNDDNLEIIMRGREILTKKNEVDTSFLRKEKENLWSESINSASQVIQISLLNPIASSNSMSAYRFSKEDLIRRAFDKLYKYFRDDFSYYRSASQDEEFDYAFQKDFNSAFVVLNKEIDQAIAGGRYPIEYKKWHSALEKIRNNDRSDFNQKSDFINSFITEEIPEILHKIKLNIHSEQDMSKIGVYFSGLETALDKNNQTKILVKKQNTSLSFQLKCRTYTEEYASALNQIHYNKKETEDLFDENGDEKQFSKKIQLVMDRGFEEKNIRSLLEETRHLFDRKLWNLCGDPDEQVPICNDIAMLRENTYSEKKIEIKPCELYYTPLKFYDGQNGGLGRCAMLKLLDSKTSFIVYFEFDENSPRFTFVRRIPLGYEIDIDSKDEIFDQESLHTE